MIVDSKKIKLMYPSSALFQRGEDRCQSNIEASTSTTVRACNDLGYVAAILNEKGYDVSLTDYQTENYSVAAMLADLRNYQPDFILLSTTNATIYEDLIIVNKIKEMIPNVAIAIKGAIFFNLSTEIINNLDVDNVDYLISGEIEFVAENLLYSHFNDKKSLASIPGIGFKKDGVFVKNNFSVWNDNLDSLPFPDRSLMNNSLYLRPDTKEVQATISTSRGCPSNCIFCLTPIISGKKIRLRSPQNVFDEVFECYHKYNIRNFFFKADTFTYNKKWTMELCNLIITSNLVGKISWVANSRVDPIDLETLVIMKKAGCWLVAFGFESGSQKSLQLMNKGTTVEQNLRAAALAKKAGLKVFGFYLIGFPWENADDLAATKKMIYKIDADFIELHLATPYYGTKLYDMALKNNLLEDTVLGKDYFNAPTKGTSFLDIEYLQKFRAKLILTYHLRPKYIFSKLLSCVQNPKIIKQYIIFGCKLVKNSIYSLLGLKCK